MRKLLVASLALVVLSAAGPAQGAVGVYEKRLTERRPIVMSQVDTNGYVSVDVYHYGGGADLRVDVRWVFETGGSAWKAGGVCAAESCSYYVEDLWPGDTYTVTVSPIGGVAHQVAVHADE